MLLAIDIGNTNITVGIFRNQPAKTSATRISSYFPKSQGELKESWRISTLPNGTADDYGTKLLDLLHYATIERREIQAIIIASVVPSLSAVFQELSQKYFKLSPLMVGVNLKISIPNLYEKPEEVGADRIVNAVAAFTRFGGPCIVVDFGTATTFDCVTKKGEYAGGIIVPGPSLAAESLALHTAKLPRVTMSKPQNLIGKNTVESIKSGLYYGYVALVDGMVERLKGEMGLRTRVVATGGLAAIIAEDSKYINPDAIFPDLTLEGLYLLWEKNKGEM